MWPFKGKSLKSSPSPGLSIIQNGLNAGNLAISDTYLPPAFLDKPLESRKAFCSTAGPSIKDLVSKFCKVDELTKNSVMVPGVEQQHTLVPHAPTKKELRRQRKLEKDKNKGEPWFNMPAPEMNDELKNDLSILQMRSVLDSKRFYKSNDLKVLPKYFQVGKVMDNATDFFSDRIPKKQRKQTLADELLADAEFRSYNKKKYIEITSKQRGKKARKEMKRLKKKK